MSEDREATVSLRWSLPFLRVTGADPASISILAREGIALKDFVDPDTRIRHRAGIEVLESALARTGDPLLGLRAGERLEPGDLDVLEYASRSCATLRDGIHTASRYMYLMHGAQQAVLLEQGELATWELRITDDVAQPAAVNDFALVSACTFARRYTGQYGVLREVHFRHAVATSASEYARIFEGATIRLGMPHNALVFTRAHLDAPLSFADVGLQAAFDMHAQSILERLQRSEGVSGRLRRLFLEELRAGDVSMGVAARKLAMSVATLRRRLSEEGTSHSELLDEVRRELAEKYLAESALAISEVAFLLGFSHVTAFYKAFRRWTRGATPAEFRARTVRI